LYQESLNSLNTLFDGYAYFQTEAPPQNLIPYIKWSLPEVQGNYIFINDPIQIRFKRGYINTLFGNINFQEHKLKLFIKDIDGNFTLIPDTGLKWLSNESSTLFPDEETWQNHLSANQILSNFKKDDILSIDMTGLHVYKSNNRYELFLIGMKRRDILNEEQAKSKNVLKLGEEYFNILSSITFTTSKFNSFDRLIRSGISENNKIAPVIISGNETSLSADFQDVLNTYVNAQIEYKKTLVDYEYGMAQSSKDSVALVSKEAVEHTKLLLRTAMDSLDEQFRLIALAINSEVLFSDSENKLRVYALKNADEKIETIWIKLPEPQKLKTNNISMGRFICELFFDSQQVDSKIFNSDTSQIIFKLRTSININELNKLKLKTAYIKDFKDDLNNTLPNLPDNIQNNHHRYDRPSFKGLTPGTVEVEGISVRTVDEQGVVMEIVEIGIG